MRVVSGIADVDFHIGNIALQGTQLVVQSRRGTGIPTTVYVERADVVGALKALVRSPRALVFLLAAPFLGMRRRKVQAAATSQASESDINNPWH